MCVNVSLRSSSAHGGVGCARQAEKQRNGQLSCDKQHVSTSQAVWLFSRLRLTGQTPRLAVLGVYAGWLAAEEAPLKGSKFYR
ncbi:hypothetical protein [Spirosoma litoris]